MKEFEIRNSRNGQWYWVNTAVNACKHISHADKCVYGSLCSFDGCKEIRPSFETIAERSNVSLRKAKLSVKKLIEVGYVEIIKGGGRGKANVYNLLKCVKGCKLCTVSNKGCKLCQERVQKKSINGAEYAPQLDKELNKEEEGFKKTNDDEQIKKGRLKVEETRKKLKDEFNFNC